MVSNPFPCRRESKKETRVQCDEAPRWGSIWMLVGVGCVGVGVGVGVSLSVCACACEVSCRAWHKGAVWTDRSVRDCSKLPVAGRRDGERRRRSASF